MLLAITIFELSSGQTYIRKYPIRISDRISGRMIGLSSNFHQYFKSTIFIHTASFRQIGWIWGNFIRPDIRPDLRIVTKIGRTLPMDNDMKSWKSHSASYYRSWVILRTDRQTNKRDRKHYLSDFIGGGNYYIACIFSIKWWIEMVSEINEEEQHCPILFLHPSG